MMTDKQTKPLSLLTIAAYVLLIGGMIYIALQSPGTCPFLPGNTPPASTVVLAETKGIKLPMLLELGSKTCVPCQMMKPILDKLEKEYTGIIKVSFVDVWLKENVAIGKKYRINSIPVQIFFAAGGKELWRHTGYISEEDILKKWKDLGYDLPALKKAKK